MDETPAQILGIELWWVACQPQAFQSSCCSFSSSAVIQMFFLTQASKTLKDVAK
jgi:hypothetical protein